MGVNITRNGRQNGPSTQGPTLAQTLDKGSCDPAWTAHKRGEREGNSCKCHTLGAAGKSLLVPVFWGSQLPGRPCLKWSFFWENGSLKEMLSFSHGKTDKHFKTETWKPKVFAGLGCSSTFHKSEEARAWLRVERSSREQEKILPGTLYFFSLKQRQSAATSPREERLFPSFS